MKRKAAHIILLFLLLVSAVLCGGCGRGKGTESGKDHVALQEELRPAVLQIFCGDYRGSGAVWEITDKEVTVISSAHLLENGDTCEVLCYAGVYYEAKVDRILEDCDIGFAVFPADVLKDDGVELTAVIPSERTAAELVRGEELVIYGSMSSVAGDFVKGYLIEAESEMQIDGYSDAQTLLIGGIILETGQKDAGTAETDRADSDTAQGSGEGDDAADTGSAGSDKGAVDAGMSGSGVFDENGKLLGILAGGDGESSFAAVPVWRIIR